MSEKLPQPILHQDVIVTCSKCNYQGPAEPVAPGKQWFEIVCWIAFLIPGIICSLWRLLFRRYACPQCKSFDEQVEIPTARRIAVWTRALLLVVFAIMFFLFLIAISYDKDKAALGL